MQKMSGVCRSPGHSGIRVWGNLSSHDSEKTSETLTYATLTG